MKHLTNQWKKRSTIIVSISTVVCAALWFISLSDWAVNINAVPLPVNEPDENPMWMMIILPFVKVAVFTLVPALLCLGIIRLVKFIAKRIKGQSVIANVQPSLSTGASLISLLCHDRIQETHDTVTFKFKAPAIDYKPGQYITLKVKIDGMVYRRAYTLSSSPSRPTHWSITVKRVQGGRVSNYLLDNLQPSMPLQATGPRGQFNLVDCTQSDHYLFISAGSGITPMIAMTRYLLDSNSRSQIHFIYFTGSIDDLIFVDELNRLVKQQTNFALDIVLSDSPADGYRSGLIREPLLNEMIPELSNHTVYTCGPTPFMKILEDYLQHRGFDMQRFHKESFGQAPAHSSESLSNSRFTISAPAFDTSVEVDGFTTLLDAIEEMNVPIIQDCRSGVCGSCKCQVTKGNVESSSTLGLSNKDVNQGYVLACSTRIKSDIELSLS
jgi:NADH oxidoreductase Hcr